MDRHEEIKQQCVQILNYYYVLPDTEFTLDTKERVDVVGYFKNKSTPDIGIEVELSSDFQHDAAKLAKTPSFQWRLIVTDHPDTLSLRPAANVNGKSIEIVRPPDEEVAFEAKIREFTNQNKRTWFNEFKKRIDRESQTGAKDPLPDFIEEILDQGLDIDVTKDIVFRTALGGIHLGFYSQGILGTEYHGSTEVPRELLYLRARNLIFEDRPGRNYDTGRQSIYYLSRDGRDLAERLIDERIREKEEKLRQIIGKYGNSSFLISLIGQMGRFVDRADLSGFLNNYPYSGVQLPSVGGSWNEVPRDLIEEFNIDSEIAYTTNVMASSPLFRETLKQVYKALTDSQLGHKTKAFSSKGDSWGEMYSVPLRALLRKLDVEEWIESSERDKLKSYAEWVILGAHNPSVPSTLYDSFRAIGSDVHEAEALIEKLVEQGITSKPVKGGASTIAIYDNKRFNDFCEGKMAIILQDILKEKQ